MARRLPGTGKNRTERPARNAHMPTRDEILRYIAENPDAAGKRELAKAFNLKGDARVELKQMLRELQDEGLIEKRRKRLSRPGALPQVTVLEIFGRDSDGGLVARPMEWDEADGVAPVVAVKTARHATGRQPGVGDRVLAKTFASDRDEGPAYSARVMKVLDKRRDAVLGVFRELADGSLRIEPVDRKQDELVVEAEDRGDAKPGDLVEVQPGRSPRHGLGRAKVMAVIGSVASEKAISMIAIHAHEIPHVFPPEVIAEAEAAKPADMEGREDWRDMDLVTIDPADAKDHDDAIHAEPDSDPDNPGGHIVTVAIADVANYVRSGSALDREALKRGNSVYFPDRVVPMLPERISNDLCSLKENVDRPALAVRMVFSAKGRKLRHSFHRIMMRSSARLAYVQAQAAIDGAPDEKTGPILETVLKPLWAAYRVLAQGRANREPLELDLPERKILLKEDGTVDRVTVPDRLDAHRLVEEYMIQANVSAAETLETQSQALVYRVHDVPSLAKQESLREFLRTVGLSLARGAQLRPAQFNTILSAVDNTENEALVNEVVLRSQSQAVYSPANIGHFGLNLQRYAHFTSPIRRYADLIVHRALIRALKLGGDGLTKDEEARLDDISALISATERRAMAAERETVDRLIASHLADQVGQVFDGRITGVTKAGLFVQLPQFGADGFIPISKLGDEYFHYDEASHAVVGGASGEGWRLGDKVEVELVEIAPMAGSILMAMASDARPLPGMTRSFHKTKAGSRARPRVAKGRSGGKGRR
ncbi:MAG: ribonuclease R [Phyllobacteriaceae bacterium]|nr:ribonuclease R [Phyllobacteriaceae bacterium]MBA89470.1 ribonuclease R [Phyllobacteriaceae bacterium]